MSSIIEQPRKEKTPIIFLKVIHSKENDGNRAWIQRRKAKQHPNSYRAGTWGCEFYNLLQSDKDDYFVGKHRYSAYMNEQFDQLLQSLHIDTMVMTGINTNTCVESTARDAHQRDYHVVVISDATVYAFPDAYEPSLRNIDRHFVSVMSSEKCLRLFRGNSHSIIDR
ncbi:cysteine hydrolase [Halalkalibacter sp. AB-rgal2]|uniref:cysteine hydrolase n=1 Tax=Halalkalibacter sp. AB-rgal2 TaxID=3242695 RepID=UPI00359D2B64